MCERCGCRSTTSEEVVVVETQTLPVGELAPKVRERLMGTLETLPGVRDVPYDRQSSAVHVKRTREAAGALEETFRSRSAA
jgi:hypothetical protein